MKTPSLGFQKPFAVRRIVKQAQMVLFLLAALGWWAGSASAAILNVGSCVKGGYATIGAAVAAASAGDTVSVCPGTYAEIVMIDQNLTLEGKTRWPRRFARIAYPLTGQCTGAPVSLPNNCPQIVVESATAQIRHLHIDGSAFALSGCSSTPVGVLFFNASGSAAHNTIQNETATCPGTPPQYSGQGIWAIGSAVDTVQVLGNYIGNFGVLGVFANAVTGNVVNNSISEDVDGNSGIYFLEARGSSALNNTIRGTGTAAQQAGINVENIILSGPKTSLVRNSVNNVYRGIDILYGGKITLNANALTDTYQGIDLSCTDNNSLVSNKVSDRPAVNGNYGVNISGCPGPRGSGSQNNLLKGNSFKGLCAGVLIGSAANSGNVLIRNTFRRIGPGKDVMPGNTCM
jgi:hypothetical protein